MKTITLEVSEDNECTRAPWWVIVDPKYQNMELSYEKVATEITGPFFSREEAELVLHNTRHNHSKRAVVYCLSGCDTIQYQREIERVGI